MALDETAAVLGDDLSSDVDLVGHVEDIKSEVVYDVGEVHLLVGIQTQSGDELTLLPGDAWHSSHDLVHVCRAVVEVVSDRGVHEDLSDVFHGVRTVVCWQTAGLSHGVDLSHVSQRGRRSTSCLGDAFVYFLVSESFGLSTKDILWEPGSS